MLSLSAFMFILILIYFLSDFSSLNSEHTLNLNQVHVGVEDNSGGFPFCSQPRPVCHLFFGGWGMAKKGHSDGRSFENLAVIDFFCLTKAEEFSIVAQ